MKAKQSKERSQYFRSSFRNASHLQKQLGKSKIMRQGVNDFSAHTVPTVHVQGILASDFLPHSG